MKQQTVTAQPFHVFVYGSRADIQIPGDLPVGHASGDLHEYPSIEVWPLLPVGCGEGLAAEGALAVEACKPLDTEGMDLSPVESSPFERPARRQATVIKAIRIGTVGRDPGFLSSVHTPEGQGSNQQHFPWHNSFYCRKGHSFLQYIFHLNILREINS